MTERIPSPQIEEYLEEDAIECRVHVFTEKGSHQVFSVLVPESDVADWEEHLPDQTQTGTVIWIDFHKHEQAGATPEGKARIRSQRIGESILAVEARQFATAQEIIENGMITPYLERWMNRYWPAGQSSSTIERTRPLPDPVIAVHGSVREVS